MQRRTLLSLFGLPLFARAEEGPATAYGGHGMAVFGGREGLYASHLPMFHSPHDSQVVLRFHLAGKQADRSLRETLAGQPRLWTFDPEPFDLLRLAPGHANPLRDFQARFYEGHFERGGRAQDSDQRVVVDEVLVFRRLDPAERQGSVGHYKLVGAGAERFAFKLIDRRPDFDHIVRLVDPAARPAGIDVPLHQVANPGAALREAFRAKSLVEIYFETGDLR